MTNAENDIQIGIVGAGLIGLSWAGLFSAFGYQTIVYDPFLKQKDLANKTIEDFINKAFSENINKLIVVTGKGLHSENEKDPYVSKDLGILKYSVPEFITNNKDLMSKINEITDAKIEDGGGGAFYIFLKKNKFIK